MKVKICRHSKYEENICSVVSLGWLIAEDMWGYLTDGTMTIKTKFKWVLNIISRYRLTICKQYKDISRLQAYTKFKELISDNNLSFKKPFDPL